MMNSLDLSMAGSIEAFGIESLDPESSDPSADVHAELKRIMASPRFDASERNRRFLAYVIEETLAGRGERIKAYSIATLVFGRDENFNPQLDPVVRMEARRLRRSLERFYMLDGLGNTLRIGMPKGGYVAEFQSSAGQRAETSRPIDWTREPSSPAISILVAPFEFEDDGKSYKNHSNALCRQIAVGLSHFLEVEVFMARPDLAADAGRSLGLSTGALGGATSSKETQRCRKMP